MNEEREQIFIEPLLEWVLPLGSKNFLQPCLFTDQKAFSHHKTRKFHNALSPCLILTVILSVSLS